ncbi:hypothetical protein ElyMa_002692200 [Elysia marginata]|uniref:Uncharacterized protein n=1 Tax=Elysia marginata TaxID=1093978 RepID=A0AAV4HD42_9GAST|nr:hypothetical protein ElyMa_002692200 [Elysia marginata]
MIPDSRSATAPATPALFFPGAGTCGVNVPGCVTCDKRKSSIPLSMAPLKTKDLISTKTGDHLLVRMSDASHLRPADLLDQSLCAGAHPTPVHAAKGQTLQQELLLSGISNMAAHFTSAMMRRRVAQTVVSCFPGWP